MDCTCIKKHIFLPEDKKFSEAIKERIINKVSHGPMCFPQPGAGTRKSFCSSKLFFCQSGIQTNIAVMFWATGRGMVYFYIQAYKDDVLLFLKNKARANIIVFLEWENTHMHQISVDHNTK